MNITKYLDEVETFELEWNGEKVTFDAKKANLTPSFLANIGEVVSYPKALAGTLTDWDVTKDDADNKWPITEEGLSQLPVDFLSAVLGKIAESWGADKKKQKASASGSAAADK
jgi:hypothetical protein